MSFKYDPADPRCEEEQWSDYIGRLPGHHPDRLAAEAGGMPWKDTAKFDLSEYGESIHTLKKKGYSYAEIAKWLGLKLNARGINRGHVYRTYQSWLELEQAKAEEAYRNGEAVVVPYLGDEEAEKRAAEDDEKSRKADDEN